MPLVKEKAFSMKGLSAIGLAAAMVATGGIVGMSPANASTAHSVTITLTPGTAIGSDGGCNNTTNISTSAQIIYARPGDTISVTWTGFEVKPAAGGAPAENCVTSISSVPGGNMTGWSFDGFSLNDFSSTGILVDLVSSSRTFTVGTVETEFEVFIGVVAQSYEVIFSVVLGDPPPTSSDSRPIVTTLTMSYGDEEACASNSIAGVRGEWVDLPPADTCSTSSRSSTVTLLGWATQPDFPVTIAHRQVDNGWGAYETFDPSGQLTGVFIPAGGATVLSNDNVLHSIWSD